MAPARSQPSHHVSTAAQKKPFRDAHQAVAPKPTIGITTRSTSSRVNRVREPPGDRSEDAATRAVGELHVVHVLVHQHVDETTDRPGDGDDGGGHQQDGDEPGGDIPDGRQRRPPRLSVAPRQPHRNGQGSGHVDDEDTFGKAGNSEQAAGQDGLPAAHVLSGEEGDGPKHRRGPDQFGVEDVALEIRHRHQDDHEQHRHRGRRHPAAASPQSPRGQGRGGDDQGAARPRTRARWARRPRSPPPPASTSPEACCPTRPDTAPRRAAGPDRYRRRCPRRNTRPAPADWAGGRRRTPRQATARSARLGGATARVWCHPDRSRAISLNGGAAFEADSRRTGRHTVVS